MFLAVPRAWKKLIITDETSNINTGNIGFANVVRLNGACFKTAETLFNSNLKLKLYD
jgi:hypothetical protein